MKQLVFLLIVLAVPGIAHAVPYTPLVNHGSSFNRVDLVIVGDGYTSADLGSGLYASDAARALAAIFSQPTYAEYEPYFNVWRVDLQSPEPGADHPSQGVFRATALDASLDCPGTTDVCVSIQKTYNAIATTGIAPDMVLVLVNDPAYGRSRPPTSGTFLSGRLLDVATTNDQVIASLLSEASDPVVNRIYGWMGPVDTSDSSPRFFIRVGTSLSIPSLSLVRPASHVLTVQWTVDGVPVASDGATLDTTHVPVGEHLLASVITDATALVLGGGLVFQGPQWPLSVEAVSSTEITAVDLNGDGRSDLATFDRRLGRFTIEGANTFEWGRPGDIPAPADYDGDARIDLAVFRPSTGTWYIPGQAPIRFGAAGDIPIPTDNLNDGRPATGRAEPTVFRPETGEVLSVGRGGSGARGGVFLLPPGGHGPGEIKSGVWYAWRGVMEFHSGVRGGSIDIGRPGDIPAPANFVGDSEPDYAVFRPSTGTWYIQDSSPGVTSMVTYHWGAPGDIPVLLDRDGDGFTELGVFRPSTAYWYFENLATNTTETVQLGNPGDIPLGAPPGWWLAHTPADADGDRRADLGVFRPSTNDWWFSRSSGTLGIPDCPVPVPYCVPNPDFPTSSHLTWGESGDIEVAADFDGDGRTDPAVFRPSDGTWRILKSSTDFSQSKIVLWGIAGDTPVQADYDADGLTDVAVFRPSTGRWYLRLSVDGSAVAVDWGLPGDVPVPADYNGDGRVDLAVFRPSTGRWYILNRFDGTYEVREWGHTGDIAAPADYDADGKADVAVFRPSEGRWYVRLSSTDSTFIADWGISGDDPQPADYDGDGKADVAVFRPSTGRWYVLNVLERDWGVAGDVPLVRRP
ncbi:MAG: FG-GAP-like repeat-containing protein [Acidobacteriota bacterium]